MRGIKLTVIKKPATTKYLHNFYAPAIQFNSIFTQNYSYCTSR